MNAPPLCRLRRGVPAPLGALRDAVDGSVPRLATEVTLHDDGERLTVTAVASDPHPWATLTAHGGEVWREEAIEVFLAPGGATPRRYCEIDLNPLGAVFAAAVDSPHGDRREMTVDRAWRCEGLRTRVEIDRERALWRAEIAIPWLSVGAAGPPESWRLNVYRIDRPPDGAPAFSAWSPTGARPADFHRPERFGFLLRVG